jgi:hypothetical protein
MSGLRLPNKQIIMGLVMIFCLYYGMQSMQKRTPEGVYRERERLKRDPLYLPDTFDDSAQLGTDPEVLANVRDWKRLTNFRGQKFDPVFWDCLTLVQQLSPEEISRRAVDLDFVKFKEDPSLRPEEGQPITDEYRASTKAAQDYRDSIRGKFVRVKGTFEPTPGDYRLPNNPSKRAVVRRFVLKREVFDLFRTNIPEAYFVYALDDSEANYKDEVQVEGIFLKIHKYYTQQDDYKNLPVLIARDVTVLKKGVEFIPNKKTGSRMALIIVAGIFITCGLGIFTFLTMQRNKQKQFRDEIFSKIKERKKESDQSDQSEQPDSPPDPS